MDDLAACADLCDQHGFPRPAAALRALAGGTPPFYLVRALMEPEYAEDEGLDAEDVVPIGRKLFLDRTSAERFAQTLTTRAIRKLRSGRWTKNPSDLADADFCQQVGAILNVTYHLPEVEGVRFFPDEATDDQMARLSELLPLEVFDVVGFAPDSNTSP